MIYESEKLVTITLPPVHETESKHFGLDTAYGRDALRDQILDDIDSYAEQAFEDGPRSHLGASVIGHSCHRYIWFMFRWMGFEKHTPKRLRLFNRGHLEEQRIVEWLTGIGFQIKQVDDETGKQVRIADCGNHLGGSSDGKTSLPIRYGLTGLFPKADLLLEIKTANESQFKIMIRNGGLIKGKPRHYAQMCVYAYKMGLRYGMYIVVNKGDDDVHLEIVELDWEIGKQNIEKAAAIINSYNPPVRISETGSYWECKWCPMNAICHLDAPVEKNCRSCRMAEPVENAEWKCHKWNAIIPKASIPVGCESWESLPR